MKEILSNLATNVVDNAGINVAVMGLSPVELLADEIVPQSEWLQPFLESPINSLNEAGYKKKMAVADQPAEPVDVPKQGLYIVDYKPLLVPTVIALVIFIVWAIATWLL